MSTTYCPCTNKDNEKEILEPPLGSMLDFAALDELDPSLVDGHRLYVEREVPLEVRAYDGANFPTEVGSVESLQVKVLVAGEIKRPESIKIEITSENNLFFHYVHEMNKEGFAEMAEAQRLVIDFAEYGSLLVRLIASCLKEPQAFLGVMVFTRDKAARLDFIQNMEHKFVELLSLKFVASPDEVVRRCLTYRYNNAKSKLAILQAKMADVNALVKIKNPSLLLHLQKTPLNTGRRNPFLSG